VSDVAQHHERAVNVTSQPLVDNIRIGILSL